MVENKQWLSEPELAERLGVSISTAARCRKDGVFPFSAAIRLQRRIIYPASILVDLEARAKQIAMNQGGVK
jgi:hypothetical protein